MSVTVETDARARYFAWKRSHTLESEDPASVWEAAWKAGAWDAIRKNASLGLNLSQIVQRLEELAHLYADHDVEREIEASSTYWHGDTES